jgi:hypothetical protein
MPNRYSFTTCERLLRARAGAELLVELEDALGQAADAARDTAATFDKWLRNTIETQPYATAIFALGIGWLLGRMHRPL